MTRFASLIGRRHRRAVPTVPIELVSIFDPIRLGIDENASAVVLSLIYRNILLAGDPAPASPAA